MYLLRWRQWSSLIQETNDWKYEHYGKTPKGEQNVHWFMAVYLARTQP